MIEIVEKLREAAERKLGFRRCEPDDKVCNLRRDIVAAVDAIETLFAENKRLLEAGKVAEEALAAVIRLAEMDFEESMLEPEENGNFASYELAKRALATIRAAIGDAS